MATTKVSELAAHTTTDGAEELLINDGGTSKKVTIANLLHDNSIDSDHYVDGSIDLAHMSSESVDEDNLHISNSGSNGQFLSKQSGDSGGLTWATPTSASTATASATGLIKIEDDTDQSVAANAVSATAGRTYGVQLNSSDQAVVNVPWVDTNTTYSVTDGELSEINFTSADHTKLNAIEASADVTDATNVTAAGALMDSEVTNLAAVKAFAAADYATAAQGTTADAALPKAGGTMTGDLILGDDVKLEVGSASGGDLQIYHDGSHSYISDQGTGNLRILASVFEVSSPDNGESIIQATDDGAVDLYHNNTKKFETTANGVTVTGGAVGTMTTDNDGSFDMSSSNNFKCTPSGNFTLTFTNIVAQSGNILLVNSGGHTVAAHANTKVDANILATITAAGTYLLAYFSDGTNVYMTNSAVYT